MTSTVCLIAKNEQRAILEWLAYQRVIGFDRVTVYDNDSADETATLVKRAAAADPAISYTAWPNEPGRRPQLTAYADALQKCETEWIAFFDTDEFVLPRRCVTINDYLAIMPPDVGCIAVNWLVFGSNGQQHWEDGLVIERFTACAMPKHGKNTFSKVIVRPSFVEVIGVHHAVLHKGILVNGTGEPIIKPEAAKTSEVDHDAIQLNHYLLKSREEYEMKLSRGHAARSLEDKAKQHITNAEEFWQTHDLNQRQDTRIIERYRDKIVARIQQLSK